MNNFCFTFNDTRYIFDLKSSTIKGVIGENNLLTKLTKDQIVNIKNIELSSNAFINLNKNIINEQKNIIIRNDKQKNIISGNDEQKNKENIISGNDEQKNKENIIIRNDEQVDRNIDLSNFKYIENYFNTPCI